MGGAIAILQGGDAPAMTRRNSHKCIELIYPNALNERIRGEATAMQS